MFHYQLNQKTGCNMKFGINMNRQPTNRHEDHQSEQPFYLPQVYSWFTPPMVPG